MPLIWSHKKISNNSFYHTLNLLPTTLPVTNKLLISYRRQAQVQNLSEQNFLFSEFFYFKIISNSHPFLQHMGYFSTPILDSGRSPPGQTIPTFPLSYLFNNIPSITAVTTLKASISNLTQMSVFGQAVTVWQL